MDAAGESFQVRGTRERGERSRYRIASRAPAAVERTPMAKQNRNGNGKDTQQLVENGKAKGFLTYDEVNESMPQDVAVDQMDDVMGVLGDEDIEIVDAATQVKIAPKRIVEEQAAEHKAVPRQAEKEDED